MLSRSWPKPIAASLALILCVAVVEAWRADRRDRAQLASELAATKQLLAAADARQRARDAQLAKTLSALDAQKRAIVTPEQIVRHLSKNIPLPAPVTLQSGQASSAGPRSNASQTSSTPQEQAVPGSPAPNAGAAPILGGGLQKHAGTASASAEKSSLDGAFLPRADLKPMYDFTLDCQACQAKLSVAQNDLADEKAKTAALTKEREDALRIAKGGNAWRRVGRAAKWFLLGTAAGAVLAKAR